MELQYKHTSKTEILSSGSLFLTYRPIPDKFSIEKVYPNPFNPRTTIDYTLPIDTEINLSLFDLQGRLIHNFVSEIQNAGYYTTIWDGSSYSSGVYLLTMEAGNYMKTQKLMLIK